MQSNLTSYPSFYPGKSISRFQNHVAENRCVAGAKGYKRLCDVIVQVPIIHVDSDDRECNQKSVIALSLAFNRASVAPTFDPVNESHGGVAVRARGGYAQSSSNRRRERLSLKCDTWSTCNLFVFFWWGRLPTTHQGHFQPSTNLKKPAGGEGALPPLNPAFKRGCPPLNNPRGCLLAAFPREKLVTFW